MVKVEFRAGGLQLATGGWHRPCLQNGVAALSWRRRNVRSSHPEPPELAANGLGRRFRSGVRRGSGQDAGAFGDAAGGSGAWSELAGYAGRWLKPDGQRPVLELLRPAAVLRSQDAAGRDAVLRPREACPRTRRE